MLTLCYQKRTHCKNNSDIHFAVHGESQPFLPREEVSRTDYPWIFKNLIFCNYRNAIKTNSFSFQCPSCICLKNKFNLVINKYQSDRHIFHLSFLNLGQYTTLYIIDCAISLKRLVPFLILISDRSTTNPPPTPTLSSYTSKQNFEITILFSVVERSRNYVFDNNKSSPPALRASLQGMPRGHIRFSQKDLSQKLQKGLI